MMPRVLKPEEAFAPFVPPINIELTSLCNLKCPYCANPTLQRPYGEMPTEMIYRLADECAREGHEILYVHGVGEPLLRKDLEAILSRFSELGIWKGQLCTNGTLLSAKRMDALVAAGLKGLYLSLDTPDADLYSRTRGGKASKVIENIRSAAERFPHVSFTVALMNHKEQVVDSSVLDLFYGNFNGLANVAHTIVENGRHPGAAEDWRRSDDGESEECSNWAAYYTITIDGRVSICCSDQEAEHVIGNVTQTSIKDIWLSEAAQNTFRSILLGLGGCPEVCYKCRLKPTTRRVSDVDPVLVGSYYSVKEAADAALQAGDLSRALELLNHLKTRNYWDAKLDAEIAALS
jgi:radical SAM protein with 4Fe4S-binding SPASM domain